MWVDQTDKPKSPTGEFDQTGDPFDRPAFAPKIRHVDDDRDLVTDVQVEDGAIVIYVSGEIDLQL